jgi:hypothetical protein
MDAAASAQAQAGEAHAAAAGDLPVLHASPAQVLPAASSLRRAEPLEFSLGVQYEVYYGKATAGLPGYPAGYWETEPSPFAAVASNPNWGLATTVDFEEDS